jgi:hypothetical protein
MSEREELIDLIRDEYDPRPNLGRGDYPAFDWDDGAGRIADAILVDRALLLQKYAARIEALEAALERIESLCSETDIINVLSAIARAALDKDAGK